MLLKALHVYTSDDRSDSSEKENADNKKMCRNTVLKKSKSQWGHAAV